jgi:hypothetical protein
MQGSAPWEHQARRLHQEADDYLAEGRLLDALASFRAAEREDPTSFYLPFNVGNVLRSLGRTHEAIEAYDRALAIAPTFTLARHNRAVSLLQSGDWGEGFREYEWRKVCPTFDDPRYKLPRPWKGEPLAGKTLYIFPELYRGDLIHFGRYALLAEAAGGSVIMAAPVTMHALLRTMSAAIRLIPADVVPPEYDYQAALLSLPMLFGTATARVPQAPQGYLSAEPARVVKWRDRIGGAGLKVGIVWQGSVRAADRSFPLAVAADALRQVPNIRLISLQLHAGLDQLSGAPSVETLGDDFDGGPHEFLDTAAAISCCDLFITADTSTVHVAGGLAARTWVALPKPADWRWLDSGETTAWYPSLRLFRQQERGDWSGVFSAMAAELMKSA